VGLGSLKQGTRKRRKEKVMKSKSAKENFVPETLLLLESCLYDEIDCNDLLQGVPIKLLVKWEQVSSILRDGLNRTDWWKQCFRRVYPITGQRLIGMADMIDWKRLLLGFMDALELLEVKNLINDELCFVKPSISYGTRIDGEYGRIEMVSGSYLVACQLDAASSTMRKFSWKNQEAFGTSQMIPIQCWAFKRACLVLFQNQAASNLCELIWISNDMDYHYDFSLWALNRSNSSKEDLDNFIVPPFLEGDDDFLPVLVAATFESSSCVCVAVILRSRHVLLFDEKGSRGRHWRDLVTTEMTLPSAIPVCGSCFVLNDFLLLAHCDGVLRAHPRGNPRSSYHVEDLESRPLQLTSLYNVIAIIHSYSILEVRQVVRISSDPFMTFNPLYTCKNVDFECAPLLYGPYVVFATLDGSWYRVNYDGISGGDCKKELIKLPYYAGWIITQIKNANHIYWTVEMKHVKTLEVVERCFRVMNDSGGGDAVVVDLGNLKKKQKI
jgi:hypothetical protein